MVLLTDHFTCTRYSMTSLMEYRTLHVLRDPSYRLHYKSNMTPLMCFIMCITWPLWCTTLRVLCAPSDALHDMYYVPPQLYYIICITWPLYCTTLHVLHDRSDVLHYMYYMLPLMYYITYIMCPLWCTTLHVLCDPSDGQHCKCYVTPLMYFITCDHITFIMWPCSCTFGLPGPLHLVNLSVQRHDVGLQSLVDAAHTVVLVLHCLQIK